MELQIVQNAILYRIRHTCPGFRHNWIWAAPCRNVLYELENSPCSNWSVNPCNLFRPSIFACRFLRVRKWCMRAVKAPIRQRGCACWSEPSRSYMLKDTFLPGAAHIPEYRQVKWTYTSASSNPSNQTAHLRKAIIFYFIGFPKINRSFTHIGKSVIRLRSCSGCSNSSRFIHGVSHHFTWLSSLVYD